MALAPVPEEVDLSSFPLLRIDQVQRHETQTLVEAEARLIALEDEEAMESVAPFVTKLLTCIRRELALRSGGKRSEGGSLNSVAKPLPATSSLVPLSEASRENQPSSKTRTPPRHRRQRPHSQTKSSTATPQPSFFVSSSPISTSSNFRSRAKLAKASLHARSDDAISQQREEERQERSRQALATMQDWRAEREKSKKRREELLAEEKEQRRRRWKERKAREEHVRSSMHAAAEEAKSMALEAGRTNEEAVIEAAAAASKVVDDESTVFDTASADSDEDSFVDNSTVDESLTPSAGSGGVVEEEAAGTSANPNETQHDDCSDARGPPSENESRADDACLHAPEEPDACREQDGTVPTQIDAPDALPNTTADSADEDEEGTVQSSNQSLTSLQDETVEKDSIESEAWPDNASSSLRDASESDNDSTSDDADHSSAEEKILPPTQPSQDDPHDSADETTTSEALQLPKAKTETGRQRLGSFPPFSDIFAKPSSGLGQKSSSDTKQRELTNAMQYQIARYTRASEAFAALTEPESEDDSSDEDDDAFDRGLFYRINSRRPEVASIIHKAFSSRSLAPWEELPPDIEDSCWNLMWMWGLPKASDFEGLLVFQKINRFRNTRGLTRKDLLKKNIQKVSARDGDSFNIMPLTYALPHEFNSFVSGYQSIQKLCGSKSANLWIIKPVGLSRGRGISVVDDIADVSYSQPIVIQRYIADPLCFMGFKFDLRMYVLVTSFSPLEAFVYKEGLARFGSRQYSLRSELLHDHRVHLTNSSIQREYDDAIDRSHPVYLAGSSGAGNKVAFSWLFQRLKGLGLDTEQLWQQMVDVCRGPLKAAGSDIPHQPNSFELFGFDLMFDQRLKCWLIEVNSSPSLGCDSALDSRIKGALVRDTIELVDPLAYDRKALAEVCKRRMTHRKSASSVSSPVAEILMGRPPRQHGQMPKKLGNFERIAPT